MEAAILNCELQVVKVPLKFQTQGASVDMAGNWKIPLLSFNGTINCKSFETALQLGGILAKHPRGLVKSKYNVFAQLILISLQGTGKR